MILEQFFISLGIKPDPSTAKTVKSLRGKIDGLQNRGRKAAGDLFSFGLAAAPLVAMLKLAADATETTNLLTVAFGENAKEVENWANSHAKHVGRSRFEIQEMTAGLGALLEGMSGSKEAAAKLATSLTAKGLDLASVYNTSDEQAINALKSALVGQVMPLRKFGIDLSQAALAQFALTQGIKKHVKELTDLERVQLRHDFILEKSTNSVGDAHKTSNELVGATKGLKGALTDMATTMGKVLEPVARVVVKALKEFSLWLDAAMQKSKLAEVVMFSLTAALVSFGIALAVANWQVLAVIAAFLVLTFVVDDLIGFLTGVDSVSGRLATQFNGLLDAIVDLDGALGLLLLPLRFSIFMFQELGKWIGALMSDILNWEVAGLTFMLQPLIDNLIVLRDMLLSVWGIAKKFSLGKLKDFGLISGNISTTNTPGVNASTPQVINSSQPSAVNSSQSAPVVNQSVNISIDGSKAPTETGRAVYQAMLNQTQAGLMNGAP